MHSPRQGQPGDDSSDAACDSHGPPPMSGAGQLALWSAANLAGMETELLVIREPFFRRLINRLTGKLKLGKRRQRVLKVRRPSPEQSLPMLADAVVGTDKSTLYSVFGPPKAAASKRIRGPGSVVSYWLADTWYYSLPRNGLLAMAINFDQDCASGVEFLQAPIGGR